MPVKAKKKKSIIVRLFAIGFAVYMIFQLVGLWRELDEGQKNLKALEEQKATTQAEIEEYKALLSDESQKAIIEKAARERFGYAYPQEEIYKEIK